MERIVKLSALSDMPTPIHDTYNTDLMNQGRAALVKRNLRFDNATGKVFDNSGCIEQFVHPSEHVPHESEEMVMRWEFRRYIANEASKLLRG